jgi:hypothetical protein
MKSGKLVVGVTGDTGWDLFTHYASESANPAQAWHDDKSIYDLYVPAGARFATIALEALFGNENERSFDLQCFAASESNNVNYSTFPRTLVFVKDYPSPRGIKRPDNGKALATRIHRFAPFPQAPDARVKAMESPLFVPPQRLGAEPVDICLVHEACGTWSAEADSLSTIQNLLGAKRNSLHCPRIIVNLNDALPEVEIDAAGRAVFTTPFWRMLSSAEQLNSGGEVCVICSATTLRQAGARLSWRLSWEQTIEELASDLIHFDRLRALARFRHLIIRFGVVAALHIQTHGRNRSAQLAFAPLAKDGVYRDRKDDGEIIGKNTFLAAALISEIEEVYRTKQFQKQIDFPAALRHGLLANMKAFDRGYGSLTGVSGELFATNFVQAGKTAIRGAPDKCARDQCIRVVDVPQDVIQRPAENPPGRRPRWQILGDQIDRADQRQPVGDTKAHQTALHVSRINLGIAIALYGHDNVLNRDLRTLKPLSVSDTSKREDTQVGPTDDELRYELDQKIRDILRRGECEASAEDTPDYTTLSHHHLPLMPHAFPQAPTRLFSDVSISSPIIQFGKLLAVERSDIETFRSIYNLIKNYVEQEGMDGAATRPISIAVFGPPGSGKSFAVKEIAASINTAERKPLEEIEYNVAQFRSIDDLGDAMMRLTSLRAQGKIPLVFFDEFDCGFRGEQLGWLKYFLAPMQDGSFFGARQTIEFGRAIFVFAGGVYNSFDDFDPGSERHAPSQSHGLSEEFRQRIVLFKTQKGPDFVSRLRGHIDLLSINTSDGQTKHIIRRAILIRSLIEKQRLTKMRCGCAVAEIDEDVLFAMLTVDRYRHGARSLEAILQMCTPINGKIEKSSLPSRSQLNMHVNADEFFIRMFRGRFRGRPSAEQTSGRETSADEQPAGAKTDVRTDLPLLPPRLEDVGKMPDDPPGATGDKSEPGSQNPDDETDEHEGGSEGTGV